jgi:putative two-component system response regulator
MQLFPSSEDIGLVARSVALAADHPARILIVEDNPHTGEAVQQLLELLGHQVDLITSGVSALARIYEYPPDLVILDANLPGLSGYVICAALKENRSTWHVPVIMMTAELHREAHLRGIAVAADVYLEKPLDTEQLEAHVRALLRTRWRHQQVERTEDVIFALARAVEAKDAYTEGHLHRMAEYSVGIGERLGLDGPELLALRYGALLHDVGKVGVDEAIIRKDGPLTAEEYALVRQHPLIGERIVQPLRLSAAIAPIVRHHHERWDGQGYPDQLSGTAIPLGARIVAVADAFDAMTSERPYNQVLSQAEAIKRLLAGVHIYWDATVVTAFLRWLEGRGVVAA